MISVLRIFPRLKISHPMAPRVHKKKVQVQSNKKVDTFVLPHVKKYANIRNKLFIGVIILLFYFLWKKAQSISPLVAEKHENSHSIGNISASKL